MGAATAGETPANTDNATMNSIDDAPIGVSENAGGAEMLLGASNDQNDILSADIGTFTELSNIVSITSSGGIINLAKDYKFDSSVDSKDGIIIDKKLTINGNGRTIDALNSARVFTVTANNVILNNITIKNAGIKENFNYIGTSINNENVILGNGAGIMWTGDNGILNNTIISGSTIDVNVTLQETHDCDVNYYFANGAGIFWTGDNAIIENTEVVNSAISAKLYRLYNIYDSTTNNINIFVGNGIGLYMGGSNGVIRKSQFKGSSAVTSEITSDGDISTNVDMGSSNREIIIRGSSVYMAGASNTVEGSVFMNNTGSYGAIFWAGTGGNVVGSTFKDNFANQGGAIYWSGYTATITDCKFINNTGNGAALYIVPSSAVVTDCDFINNTGKTNGAVYWNGGNGLMDKCNFINSRISQGDCSPLLSSELSVSVS